MLRKLFVIITVLAFAAVAYAQQTEIEQVKNTQITGYSTTNIGKAFESFFLKPQWDMLTTNDGTKIVTFKGVFKSNPYADYIETNEYKNISKEDDATLLGNLYDIAYDFGLRRGNWEANQTRSTLRWLTGKAYTLDSPIEVFFQQLNDGKTWWIREYKCDTCPGKDVNDLMALVLDNRFVGALGARKTYVPAGFAVPASAAPAQTQTQQTPQTQHTKPEHIPDRKIGTTTRIAQFKSLNGNVAYFDVGRGEQEFIVSERALPKVQALAAGGMTNVTFDTVERHADGRKITVFIVTDIRN